ncbi:MAG: HD domain-containing protein [Endomicrobium sp.]|jgi:metal-dependent HD superfamily phosphatase/phosphodiesterase|nr:HD domain-containing protein [Endomicrobium sp.]
MNDLLTFEEIKNNAEIQTYLEFTDKAFALIGYKEHGIGHALYASEIAERILKYLGYSKREQELAKIAAYIHDVGNMISKYEHDQSSAIMFLNVLSADRYNEEVFAVANAVGSHEDKTTDPVSSIAAVLVLGDKTDVRRERLRAEDLYYIDKHSRVIAACQKLDVIVNKEKMIIELRIKIDTTICSVMDYFEIFMSRTNYCRRASSVLNCKFELYINEDKFL